MTKTHLHEFRSQSYLVFIGLRCVFSCYDVHKTSLNTGFSPKKSIRIQNIQPHFRGKIRGTLSTVVRRVFYCAPKRESDGLHLQ